MPESPTPRPRRWPRRLAIAAGVLLGLGVAVWFWLPHYGLNTAKRYMRWQFPEVPTITTTALAAWLADSNRTAPLLLDVRLPEEFAVSHLPDARHAPPDTDVAQLLRTLPADRPLVLYCAAGYRSANLAQQLREAGHTNVFNLEGSIFAWAQEGRPLLCGNATAHVVHPFNWLGTRLIPRECQADLR